MKRKRSHTRSLLAIALMFLMCSSSAQADIILGSFDFNSSQFGNTLLESDGGTWSTGNWLNISNANPGNPGYLTGPNFDTGIGNIGSKNAELGSAVSYTIGYNTPIVNNAGADFGVVVARFSADDFYLALSADGTTFTDYHLILAADAVPTLVGKSYYFGGTGPFVANLFVHPIDISDFGFSSGTTIIAMSLNGSIEGGEERIQLDLIRAAGFAPVPLPGAVYLLGSGLVGLAWFRMRRKNKA
jgi:hypothetical protein